MARNAALPILTAEPGLTHYLEEIRRFPMLERQEEYMLGKRWREHGDRYAAHKLVTSHLRLVTKIARDYRGYGLPISEAISEGNVGLMQAVERFEPEKGFRFATYAVWWIKAAIQEYILRSWSLVKIGTSANQKKVFPQFAGSTWVRNKDDAYGYLDKYFTGWFDPAEFKSLDYAALPRLLIAYNNDARSANDQHAL